MRQIMKGKITWIDISSPTKEDIEYLRKNYHFHPLICKELEEPSQRSRAETYDQYIFLITHFPSWNPEKQVSYPWELDVILSKDVLVTVCYQKDSQMHQELMEKIYSKDFEKKYLNNTVMLFHFIIDDLIEFALREITHIQSKVDQVEEEIFRGGYQEVIPKISYVKRDILNFRRISRYLKENLNSLARRGPLVFGKNSTIYFNDLAGDILKLDNLIENFKDTIESLESTNNSFISYKINNLTKVFTVISFITWPALLIISSYQMNVSHIPLTNLDNGFWIVLFIAAIPSILIFLFLKKRKFL